VLCNQPTCAHVEGTDLGTFVVTAYNIANEADHPCSDAEKILANGLNNYYCPDFLADIIMQGSGVDNNNKFIQIDWRGGKKPATPSNTFFTYVPYIATKSGQPLVDGVSIAVDPSVIPLNSWVYIESIGWRRADDTGGAIKGKRIDVFMNAPRRVAMDFGKKNLNVVLKQDLGGINFTSIRLNYIGVTEDSSGNINFDYLFKAQKAKGTSPGINVNNSTTLGLTAFKTGLVVPNNKFWVNLMPWEPDRIIDEQLAQSEVGRIMLEADLQMKRDISNYENPCANETGKASWILLDKKREALTQRCMERFPGEIKNINNVWFNPTTRFWIVPDKVYAYINGTQIYIINATLTIYSEPVAEHSSFQVENQDTTTLSKSSIEELNKSAKEYGQYEKELIDRMILPYVVADVNYRKTYEDLRDVYVALALAQWYKSRITHSMDIFRNNLDSSNYTLLKAMRPWSPKEIWDEFIYSYKNGEYKCWENVTTNTAEGIYTESKLRKSGGVDFARIKDHLVEVEGMPPEVQDQVKRAITYGFIAEEKDVLFGNRLKVNLKQDNLSGSGSLANAIRRDPNLALDWCNRGIALQDQGKLDEAIEAYDEAIRLDPELALAWCNKAAALVNKGKLDEAIAACDNAIWLDPNYASAWNNKGTALGKQGKYNEAIDAYDEATRLNPNYVDAWNNKGNVLAALGRNTDAEIAFARAKELGRDD
jgi:tetratricopeptide (TPR) repeat protein/3D (Asp-Asp-Asp) domain-containing protein